MDSKPKKRGRPKGYRAENPASERLTVRVTDEQLDDYRAAADTSGTSLSDWVRSTLDRAARLLKK